jgi:transcriptional regulator with XRE-family HTH domain
MDRIVDQAAMRIAQRVRHERDDRGWSLADLAERSGVAKATISRIERVEMSPTAVTLLRLAGAFDLTLAMLLLRAEGEGERLSRFGDQTLWRDPDSGYLRRQIFSRPDHPLELVQIEMPAGRRVVLPASSYARIRQLVMVKAGELTLVEDGVQHVLLEGDCLGFGSPSEVTFANEAAVPCLYLVFVARS